MLVVTTLDVVMEKVVAMNDFIRGSIVYTGAAGLKPLYKYYVIK